MRIRVVPGGEFCLDCGSFQFKIDPIQHEQYCEEIRVEQEWEPVNSIEQVDFGVMDE